MGLKRLSAQCRACRYVGTCDHKEMEAVGYLPEESIIASAVEPTLADLAAPIMVKHDYRDVKVSENVTVTIDIEDLKKKMVEDFYADLHHGLYGMLSSGA